MKHEHEHHKHCYPPEYPPKQHHYEPPRPPEEYECKCCNEDNDNDNEDVEKPTVPIEPNEPDSSTPDFPFDNIGNLLDAAILYNNKRCKVCSSSLPTEQTPFEDIYSLFLDKITEDMYMEMTEEDTKKILESLLISSLIWFEFPRFELDNYSLEDKVFYSDLTFEEKDIIASYMIVEWLGQQLASVENVRMKYSGSTFRPRYLEINK